MDMSSLQRSKSAVSLEVFIEERSLISPTNSDSEIYLSSSTTGGKKRINSAVKISDLIKPLMENGTPSLMTTCQDDSANGISGGYKPNELETLLKNNSFKYSISSGDSTNELSESSVTNIVNTRLSDALRRFSLLKSENASSESYLPEGVVLHKGKFKLPMKDPKREPFLQVIKDMLDAALYTNVRVVIDQIEFQCHEMILQKHSEYFRDKPFKELHVLSSKDVTPNAFMIAYNLMLNKRPDFGVNELMELFLASKFLGISWLTTHCWILFDNHFREILAFLCAIKSFDYGLKEIGNMMLPRVSKSILMIIGTRDFLQLKCNEVCTILSSNSLGVNSEIEVLWTVILWLNYDWEKRKDLIIPLIECVRFGLLPAWVMILMQRLKLGSSVERIINHPILVEKFQEGITYDNARKFFVTDPDCFSAILKKHKLFRPTHRQWIYDKNCNHHHLLNCTNKPACGIKIKDYLSYLEYLQGCPIDYYENIPYAKEIDPDEMCQCGCLTKSDVDIRNK